MSSIIVPARLASQRFPRKLLFEVEGKPIILWTAERIRSEAPEFPLYFAVAEEELRDVLEAKGYQTVMTDPDLPSGTDRLAQANAQIGAKYVINVQADEPLVTGEQIRTLHHLLHEGCDMATMAVRFTRPDDFLDANKVKVVLANDRRALYFSRSPIPHCRDLGSAITEEWLAQNVCWWHLGLYGYTQAFLEEFSHLKPGKLEMLERLEQLRALENNFRILVGESLQRTIGIDTPEDGEQFAEYLKAEFTKK